MEKYIIFSGCSFTWGQGLWMYADESVGHLPTAINWTSGKEDISVENQDIRKEYRFAEKVCNDLGDYYPLIKVYNGGTDVESVNFIDGVFREHSLQTSETSLWELNTTLENVDYIILQTTQVYRSRFLFKKDGKQYVLYSDPDFRNLTKVEEVLSTSNPNQDYWHFKEIPNGEDFFINWLIDNNYTIDDFKQLQIKAVTNDIENCLKKYHNLGKKVFLLSWTNEFLQEIINRPFLKDIFIPLYYKDKIYSNIGALQLHEKNMRIDNDINIKRDTGFDEHPSKEAHEIIYKSIMNKIKNEKVVYDDVCNLLQNENHILDDNNDKYYITNGKEI